MLIFKKIPAIMSEVGAIEKNRSSADGPKYKFRGIDDLYFALQPLLSKHGVFFTPNIVAQSREERQSKSGNTLTYSILNVEFTFYAEDGSFFKATTVGEAMDTSDKSSNKAMSAALKYALLEVFCIPTEEEKDTEYNNYEASPKKQWSTLTVNWAKASSNSSVRLILWLMLLDSQPSNDSPKKS